MRWRDVILIEGLLWGIGHECGVARRYSFRRGEEYPRCHGWIVKDYLSGKSRVRRATPRKQQYAKIANWAFVQAGREAVKRQKTNDVTLCQRGVQR